MKRIFSVLALMLSVVMLFSCGGYVNKYSATIMITSCYGDEASMEGCEDPFNRRCYPWGSEDKNTVEYFTALGKLRAFDEFNDGDIKIEKASDGVFIFTRGDKFKVIVNASDKEYELGGKKTDIVSGKTASKIASLGAIVYQI